MPVVEKPKTVLLKGSPLRKEAEAGAPITPGMLLKFGANDTVVPHDVAGGNARKAFALEWDPAKEIDDPYAVGDQVMYAIFRPGEEVYALLAAGENVSKGDALESAGDGSLRKHTPPTVGGEAVNIAAIVGFALETVNNSGGTGPVRIRVEVA